MGGKGSGGHLHALNRKRSITPHTVKNSEKAISDSQRVKQEQEQVSAAKLWRDGYDRERLK